MMSVLAYGCNGVSVKQTVVLFPSKKRGVNGIDGVCIYNNEYTAKLNNAEGK